MTAKGPLATTSVPPKCHYLSAGGQYYDAEEQIRLTEMQSVLGLIHQGDGDNQN